MNAQNVSQITILLCDNNIFHTYDYGLRDLTNLVNVAKDYHNKGQLNSCRLNLEMAFEQLTKIEAALKLVESDVTATLRLRDFECNPGRRYRLYQHQTDSPNKIPKSGQWTIQETSDKGNWLDVLGPYNSNQEAKEVSETLCLTLESPDLILKEIDSVGV